MSAPAPGSPEWARLVTASKVAAILSVSPWSSPRAVWHEMRGDVPHDNIPTVVQSRGHYLEAGVLAWWRDQHPELVNVEAQPWCSTVEWGGSTPDLRATTNVGEVVIAEAKTAANDDEWGDEHTDEIPTHYLTQAYWQMAMDPTARRVYVPVLTNYLRFAEYVIERDDAVIADLIARCHRFYLSLSADVPPPLDDHPATVDVLRRLNPDVDRGTDVVLDAATATEWVAAGAALKDAEARERAARAVVLDRMGRAQYAVTACGLKVARRQSAAHGVSLVRTAKPSDLMEAAA